MLLLADGCVKLCDLGMSKFVDQNKISISSSGGIVGSPTYMPPEAFGALKGNSGETLKNNNNTQEDGDDTKNNDDNVEQEVKVDGKAWDQYSLGVVLWWMWHNQDPFLGNTNIFQVAEIVKNGGRPAWFKKKKEKKVNKEEENISEVSEEQGDGVDKDITVKSEDKEDEEGKEDEKYCFIEAPQVLINFVNDLWAQESFDRLQVCEMFSLYAYYFLFDVLFSFILLFYIFSFTLLFFNFLKFSIFFIKARDALLRFKSEVSPIVISMSSLRPNIELLEEQEGLGVSYINSYDDTSKKKKSKGVKFNFEDITSTSTPSSSTTSTAPPLSPTVPLSPKQSTTPLSSLMINKANKGSDRVSENNNDDEGSKVERNTISSSRPSLFQPPLPPSTPTNNTTNSNSSSTMAPADSSTMGLTRVDMVSAPDGELQQCLLEMMTPDKIQSTDSLRSRLMLELAGGVCVSHIHIYSHICLSSDTIYISLYRIILHTYTIHIHTILIFSL